MNGSLAIEVPVAVAVHVFVLVSGGCVKHVFALPLSSVEEHAFVFGLMVHVTSASRDCTSVVGSWYQSSSSGSAWNRSVSTVWKYARHHGKMSTSHWYCGRTTGTSVLPSTPFALSMSRMPVRPSPP